MENKVTRLYTGADGKSHLGDIEIPLHGMGDIRRESEIMKAKGIIFVELGANHNSGWHNAPRRQFVIGLEGEVEIEVGDGSKRRLSPGDVLLAEDTKGQGHITRVLNNQPRKSVFIPLA